MGGTRPQTALVLCLALFTDGCVIRTHKKMRMNVLSRKEMEMWGVDFPNNTGDGDDGDNGGDGGGTPDDSNGGGGDGSTDDPNGGGGGGGSTDNPNGGGGGGGSTDNPNGGGGGVEKECPDGWMTSSSSRYCYKPGRGSGTYRCSSVAGWPGAKLIEPRSYTEIDMAIRNSPGATDIWVGLTEGSRHNWRWASGGGLSESSGLWAPGEPNDAAEDPHYQYPIDHNWWTDAERRFNPAIMFSNYPSERPDTERCAHIHVPRGAFNDGKCSDRHAVLCQVNKKNVGKKK